jgi:hypothetical protein
MNGWVKLHRNILEWEWYHDTNVKCLFIHLLISANHKDKQWRGITIKRGELVTSYAHLSDELSLSVKQIRIALSKLNRTGETASKTTNKYSLIRLVNYDYYQDYENEGTQEGKQQGSQGASRGQAEGKQRATNKNDKKERREESKEVKNKNAEINSAGIHEILIADFIKFHLSEKDFDYTFQGAKDGSATKSLISKIKKTWKTKHEGIEPNSQEIKASFGWMLKNLTPWVQENLTLANINSQFNQIVDHGKNGKKKTNGYSPDGFERAFEKIKQRHALSGSDTSVN